MMSTLTSAPERSALRGKASAYLALMKPRIIELLLVTALPTMVLAAGGLPPLVPVIATLVGGFLSAGAANTFNMILDRDIDRVMKRTQGRPLVTGAVSVAEAHVFAWILTVVSTAVLWVFANWVAAMFSVMAIAFYAIVYTMLLKRRTEQNIVWGGIAGCFPVVIGWSAVTGGVDWPAWILFTLVFLWTPAHYWPLSMKYRADYSAAGVPMLAVVRGKRIVGIQVILYAWASVACTLLLIPVAGMGLLYCAVAIGAGLWFVVESHLLYGRALGGASDIKAMRVFHASNLYLTLIFVAVGIDPLLPI
ncbi:Heme O synthase, protoheme IX farnesyltransferase COX10-CtaB [Agrococcus casei LMG 22410]|uniref:Protoheme IX farnesyltransferase n=2 Tax=Agrococcus TaxID=46352 RepID=A0A1R4FRW3_9MICO|nr:Heme O synthase, protoheme IX farnesyltransferase COX10-CtaB [Agrococcus casei LMG 22410]